MKTALIVGVGAARGLGTALCRRFAAEGYHVVVSGRTAARIEEVAEAIRSAGGSATAVAGDAAREADVIALFDQAMAERGGAEPLDLVVYNVGGNQRQDFRDIAVSSFQEMWQSICLGGFLVGREVARRLVPGGHGTIIFTGASGSLRGMPGFASFSAAKAGLRMIAQSMAREFGPQGLHVAHVIIDGGIDGDRLYSRMPAMVEQRGKDGLVNIDAIAETYWQIHRQHPSAWTHEVDLRPYKETF